MSTKTEERAALKKIRKIVEDLGEDSYLAMAFEGCWEIAESNIDNDWGCSHQQKIDGLNNQIAGLKDQLENLRADHDWQQRRIAKLETDLTESKKLHIPRDLYISLYNRLTDDVARYNQRIAHAAEELAGWADSPKDIAVAGLLKTLKSDKARRDEAQQILAELEKHEPDNI